MSSLHTWKLRNFFGQPIPQFDNVQNNTYFSCVETGLSVIQFVSVAFFQFVGQKWEESGSISTAS